MNLKIKHKKKFGKVTNTWGLKNILLKNEWAKQEVKEEIKKYMAVNEKNNNTAQNLWDAAKAVLRGLYSNPGYKSILRVYSIPGLPKEGRKISDTQPNLRP